MNKGLTIGVMVVLAVWMPLSAAYGQEEALNWKNLTVEQQQLLKGFEKEWAELDTQRQNQLVRGAERWSEMSMPRRVAALLAIAVLAVVVVF